MPTDKQVKDIRSQLKSLSGWGKNITTSSAKMFLASGKQFFESTMPTVTDTAKVNAELVGDIVRIFRNPVDAINRSINKAMETDDVKSIGKFAKNALDDLKSGKLYDPNRDRTEFGMAMDDMLGNFGGIDWDDFDVNGDFTESEPDSSFEGDAAIANYQEEEASKRTAATIGAIGASTEAITQTVNANGQANIRLSMKQHAQVMNVMTNQLSVQASTLSAIDTSLKASMEVTREAHNQIMGKLDNITDLLGQIRDGINPPKQEKPYKAQEDIYGDNGGLDLRKYIKQVIRNIDDELGISTKKSIITGGMGVKDLLELVADNPWKLVTDALIGRIVPERLQKQMGRTDRNLKNFVPALLESFSSRKNNVKADGTLSPKDFILSLLGVKQRSKSTIDTAVEDVNQKAAITNRTTIAIEQVIPTYLSMIHSDLSGQPALTYNYKSGRFEKAREVVSRYIYRANDLVGANGAMSELMSLADAYTFRTTKERDEFRNYLYAYLQSKSASGSNRFINPNISPEKFKESMPYTDKKDDFYNKLMGLLGAIDRADLTDINAGIFGARRERDERNPAINKELSESGLIAAFSGILGSDLEDDIIRKTTQSYGGLSKDALANVEKTQREKLAKAGAGSRYATNIILDSILGTLKKGIITYSYGMGEIPATSDMNELRRSIIKGAVDQQAFDAKAQEIQNRTESYKKELYDRQMATAAANIKSGKANTTLDNAYASGLSADQYRDIVANYRIKKTEPGQSGNAHVETLRRIQDDLKGTTDDILKNTGVTSIFGTVARMTQSPFAFMEETLKYVDAFMFKMLYGEDAMLDISNGTTPSLMSAVVNTVKTQLIDARNWFGEHIGNPIKDKVFDKEKGLLPRLINRIGDMTKPVQDKIKGKVTDFKNRTIGEAVKDEDGKLIKYKGGKYSDKVNKIVGSGEGSIEDRVSKAFDHLLWGDYADKKRKGVKYVRGKTDKKTGEYIPGHNEYGGVMGFFKKQFDRTSVFLFGDPRETDPEAKANNAYSKKRWRQVMKEFDIAAPDMVIGAGVGVLGSLFLPGGPLLGGLIGSFAGLIHGSDKFKEYLFGKELTEDYIDPVTGKKSKKKSRAGGIISKQVYDGVKKFAPKMGIGALVGAAAGGLGLLPFGMGPVVGSVIGSVGGMVGASDQMRELIFGNYKDPKSGLISKEFRDKVKDQIKKYAPTTMAGALAGNMLWSLGVGLIPGLAILPGGPILTMLGALMGGTNAEEIKKFFFGDEVEVEEETTDKDGKKVKTKSKKRKGGIFGSAFDTAKNKVLEPFANKINSIGANIADWFKKDIVGPFSRTVEPMKIAIGDGIKRAGESLRNIGTTVTDGIKNAIGISVDTTFGDFMRNKIVKPMERMTDRLFGAIGKAIGTVISAPFKLLELVFTGHIKSEEDEQGVEEDGTPKKQSFWQKILSKRAARKAAKDINYAAKRTEGARGRVRGFFNWFRSRGPKPPKADPSKAGTPGYTRQGVPIEGYGSDVSGDTSSGGFILPTGEVIPAGGQVSNPDGSSYYVDQNGNVVPDTTNPPADDTNQKPKDDKKKDQPDDKKQAIRLSIKEKNEQNKRKRENDRNKRNQDRQKKKADRDEKRKKADEERDNKRKQKQKERDDKRNNEDTSTDDSRSGKYGRDGKRRKLGRKTDNEYLANIDKYTQRIYKEIHGQINGVGWNTAYIKTILELQNGPVDPSLLPEEMEGSKKIKKRRNIFQRAFDRGAEFFGAAGDKIRGVGRAIRDKLDFILEPFFLLKDAAGAAKDAVVGFASTLWDGAKKVGGVVKSIGVELGSMLAEIGHGVAQGLGEFAKGAGAALGEAAAMFAGATKDVVLGLTGLAGGMFRIVGDIAPDIAHGLWEGAKFIGKGAFKGIGAAAKMGIGLGRKLLGKAGEKIFGKKVKDEVHHIGSVEVTNGVLDAVKTVDKVSSIDELKIGPKRARATFPHVLYSKGKIINRANNYAIPVFLVGSERAAIVNTRVERNPNDAKNVNEYNIDDYKRAYDSIDQKAEHAKNAADAYDRALSVAKTPAEIAAIRDAQQMNANRLAITGKVEPTEEKSKSSIFDFIKNLLPDIKLPSIPSLLSKLGPLAAVASSIFAIFNGLTNEGEEHQAVRGLEGLGQMAVDALGIRNLKPGQVASVIGDTNMANTYAAEFAQDAVNAGTKRGSKKAMKAAWGANKFGKIADFFQAVANPNKADAMIAFSNTKRGKLAGYAARGINNVGTMIRNTTTNLSDRLRNSTAGQKVLGVVDDVSSKVPELARKAGEFIKGFFSKITGNKTVKRFLGSKLMTKISAVAKVVVDKLTGAAFKEAAEAAGKETIESTLRMVGGMTTGGILTAVFAVTDFISGWNSATSIFKVNSDNVTIPMRATAAIYRCVSGLISTGGPWTIVLSIALSIVEDVLVQEIYKIFAGAEAADNLKQAQAQAAAGAEAAGVDLNEYVKNYESDGDKKQNIFQKIGSGIANAGKAVWNGITNVAGAAWNGIKGAASSVANFLGFGNGPGRYGTGRVTPMSQKAGKYNIRNNNMALAGCGPTVASMVGSAYGDKRSPMDANRMSYNMGMREADGGTNPAFFSQYAASFGAGYGMSEGPTNQRMVESNLRSGKPVVLMGRGGKFGNHMHYLVADGMTGRGTMSYVDPLTGGRKTAGIGEMIQNTKSTVYSYGTGTEVQPQEAQNALVGKMKWLQEHPIQYSLKGAQDPDQGSASCASTVGWAYKKVLGITGMSASSSAQSKDDRFTDVVRLGQPGAQPGKTFDTSILQPGDIVYMFNKWNGGSSNHTEMYIGNGKDLSHGGPDPGPQERTLDAARQKKVFAVRRYKGFVDGNLIPVTEGYNTNTADGTSGEESAESSGWLGSSKGFQLLSKVSTTLGNISTALGNKINSLMGISTGETGENGEDVAASEYGNISATDAMDKNWKHLINAGYNKYAASGIMGCWNVESGNRPNIVEGYYLKGYPGYDNVMRSNATLNDYTQNVLFPAYQRSNISISESGYKGEDGNYYPGLGLAQWTGPRAYKLIKNARDSGIDWRSHDAQLAYFDKEAADRGLLAKMNQATSTKEAARLALDNYEMYSGYSNKAPSALNKRAEAAAQIYNTYKDKTFDTGSKFNSSDPSSVKKTELDETNRSGKRNWKNLDSTSGAGPGFGADANVTALSDKISNINRAISAATDPESSTMQEVTNAVNKAVSSASSTNDPALMALIEAISTSTKAMVQLLQDIKKNTQEGSTPSQDIRKTSTPTSAKNKYSDLPMVQNEVYSDGGYEVSKRVIDKLTRK